MQCGYDGRMATNKPQDDYQKQGVRIPRELHARIHEAAAASGRSYNSELIARLEASFNASGIDRDVALAQGAAGAVLKGLERVNQNGELLVKRLESIESRLVRVESLQTTQYGTPSVVQGPAPTEKPQVKKLKIPVGADTRGVELKPPPSRSGS